MKALGVSLSHFGYYQGVLALLFAFGSVLFGLVMRHFKPKKALQVNNYIFMFSLLSMAWVTIVNSTNPIWITLAFIPFVIGQIIPSTILYPLCLNFISDAKGRISALITGGRLVLCALSLQFAGFIYQGSFQHIGMIILPFILLSVVTLFKVIREDTIVKEES